MRPRLYIMWMKVPFPQQKTLLRLLLQTEEIQKIIPAIFWRQSNFKQKTAGIMFSNLAMLTLAISIPWQMWVAWCLHDFYARGHRVCSWALDTSLLRNLSAPWCTFVNGTAGDNPAMDYIYCSIPSTGRRNTVTSCYWIYKKFLALAWWLLGSYADLDRASHCMSSTSCRLFGSRTCHKDSNTAVLNLSH